MAHVSPVMKGITMGACEAAPKPSPRATLMGSMLELLGSETSAGLSDILLGFRRAGLDDAVSSWVGKGRNLPISPAQLTRALGPERVTQLAQQSGMTADAAARILSELLPPVVDHLTPDGDVPEPEEIWKIATTVKRALGA